MSNPPCPFECAILSRTCGCRYAVKHNDPLRQKIYCDADTGNRDCVTTLNHFRKSVNFSLGLARAPNALPRSQAMLLQKGVLIGLQNALDKVVENSRVNNVYETIHRALKRYGSPQELPQQEIIRSIAANTR